MKTIINYTFCSLAICIAIIMTISGGWQTLVGICLDGIIWYSMLVMPTWWRMFYKTNLRILNYFGLL